MFDLPRERAGRRENRERHSNQKWFECRVRPNSAIMQNEPEINFLLKTRSPLLLP
jgi:hypothetical protein